MPAAAATARPALFPALSEDLLLTVRAALLVELQARLGRLLRPSSLLPGVDCLDGLCLGSGGVPEAAGLGVSRSERLKGTRVRSPSSLGRPLCPLDRLGAVPDRCIQVGREEPGEVPRCRGQARVTAEGFAEVEDCAGAPILR